MTDYCKVTEVCYWLWLAGTMTTATLLPFPPPPPSHIKQLNSLIWCTYCHFLWRLTVGTNLNKRFPKHNVQCRSCSEWKIIINNSWMFSKHLKTLGCNTRGCKWKAALQKHCTDRLLSRCCENLLQCFTWPLLCSVAQCLFITRTPLWETEELLTHYWFNLKLNYKHTF